MAAPEILTTTGFLDPQGGGIYFDNGLILSDGYGHLIAQSFNLIGVYNPVAFGADATGAKDSTSAWNTAIASASSAGGGLIQPSPGTYSISNSIIVAHDNVALAGFGRNTMIQTFASFPASTPMVWYQGPGGAGNFRYGATIKNLRLVNTAGPTSAIGIQMDSTYWAKIERVDVEGVYANNIFLNGLSNAFGAYTTIRGCHIGAVPGGATSAGIGVNTTNHEFSVIDKCVINWLSAAGGIGVKLQNGSYVIDGCTFDECDTGVHVFFQSHNRIVNCEFDRGLTQFVYLNGSKNTGVINNSFQSFVGSGSKSQINVDQSANASNVIADNTCKASSGWTNFVTESSGVTTTNPNTYENNDTAGLTVTRISGIFAKNRGYNPVGSQSAPGIPGTGVALLNPFGVDCMVSVTGGTVTNVSIGATTTGLTSGWFRIPANQTITLAYSVAPSWAWYGE